MPYESIFLSAWLSSWIASNQPLLWPSWKTVADQKMSARGRLGRPRIWWGSGPYTPMILRTTLGRKWQRLYESSRARARQGDLQGTLGRPQADVFWSSEDWGIAPDLSPPRYRVVLDRACRFPTIFAKIRTIDQKKDWVLSGPKQSLVKLPFKFQCCSYQFTKTFSSWVFNQNSHICCLKWKCEFGCVQ